MNLEKEILETTKLKQSVDTTYVVITPVRNEAQFIEQTIRSMAQQTIKPAEWIIVNDGSTDETAEIVAKYAADYPWLKLVHREDRGIRQRGKGVVETFYVGYNALTYPDYDFIVKLDGDVTFDPTYFEAVFNEFAANPKLGVAGGGIYEKINGQNWTLQTVKTHVRGATKVYKRACFEAIGGLKPIMGWDGIDEWHAAALGWEFESFPKLEVRHYRLTGAASGLLKSKLEMGYGAYCINYHPLFIIARGIGRMFNKPYLIGGLTLIAGYFIAGLQGKERLSDPFVVDYIRKTQMKQLADLLVKRKPIHS